LLSCCSVPWVPIRLQPRCYPARAHASAPCVRACSACTVYVRLRRRGARPQHPTSQSLSFCLAALAVTPSDSRRSATGRHTRPWVCASASGRGGASRRRRQGAQAGGLLRHHGRRAGRGGAAGRARAERGLLRGRDWLGPDAAARAARAAPGRLPRRGRRGCAGARPGRGACWGRVQRRRMRWGGRHQGTCCAQPLRERAAREDLPKRP